MADTVHFELPVGQWVKIVGENTGYSLRVAETGIMRVAMGGDVAPTSGDATFLVENPEYPQQGIHYGDTRIGDAVWAMALSERTSVNVALYSPSFTLPSANMVTVTPTAVADGAVVEQGAGVLYGAEVPAGSPAVTLLDDGQPIAFLVPGVPVDFTARPRPFAGPLTALAASVAGIVDILVDVVAD